MIREGIILFICLIGFGLVSNAQDCPDLTSPIDGATNVAVDATINWTTVEGVTGYIISIGTTPGASDIVNEQPTGSSASYTPELGLPDNTLVYVTITLFYFNLPDIVCLSQSFTTENVTQPPVCTNISGPSDGDVNVNVASNINWSYATGATGYILRVGTVAGGNDLINDLDVGNVLFYNLPADLPAETEIYVEVIPYNENGDPGTCFEESFVTGTIAALPECTTIIDPVDGAINIPLSPLIEWEAVPGAVGYRVYIGTTPFENDILDGGIFDTNSTFVINFEPNSVYFIRVIPFNAAGDAIGCSQSSFSTILGCGPFLNPNTGELETLYPILDFPVQVGICLNESPTVITATDAADGYRWYAFNDQDELILISSEAEVTIENVGTYRYEAYVISNQEGIEVECADFRDFTVVSSEIATINGVNITESTLSFDVEVLVSGIGDYEFSIDSADGPYQINNVFNDIPEEATTIYVRDRNGCGIVTFNLENLIVKKGFPRFFTPNNDGVNDRWQFVPSDDDTFQLSIIYIFDRYGKLIKSLNPLSPGWAGDFNGLKLPNSDFWYRALTTDGKTVSGHFTLKR
ncbi:MAG: T9SS type B sorting domain-containing protein [Flavobacteriaceae bacterium]|nr:T9SS type B sorting domain-containing protein [Bacteroidia bacterium]MBT8289078.1 T9SS type B sorting domain-containing protein [Bacteroidia bacterium]NNF74977.1 T9SS type B sorting domain-containing protein [Flavobacteriaceae bacterium]NNK71721.1 T9SS type B sorting domain-containing protein [Flavobacteriaceae bacterium]